MDFFGGQLVVITDQSSALSALTTVVEQGEGDVVVENSHYTVFTDLYQSRKSWDLYRVPKNPKTWDYKNKNLTKRSPYIYAVSDGFCISSLDPLIHSFAAALLRL